MIADTSSDSRADSILVPNVVGESSSRGTERS